MKSVCENNVAFLWCLVLAIYNKEQIYLFTRRDIFAGSYCFLHFAWVVHDAKCIVVTRVCVCVCVYVCLSVCPRPYAHTTAWTRM